MSDTLMDFDEAVRRYDPVLGLEVHVELGTATKMFDAAPNVFGAQPNTMVTPTSVGLPGALPVVNARGVEYAIRIGLALGCEIAQSCRFARKNYFYPDLAKDFQTSQSDEPIAYDGALEIEMEDGSFFTIPIERAHMEEDAGKNTHIGGTDGRIEGASHSLVDYNRAGVPLVEIVTRPIEGTGARAPQVAAAYVRTLRDIFRALGVSEARMERGNVRADVNVSLRESPDAPLGTRTETKNATPSVGSSRSSATRSSVRPPSWPPGERCFRRPVTARPTAPPVPVVSSPTPMTTATSPSRTWFRWRPAANGSRRSVRGCPRCLRPSVVVSRPSGV